MKMVHVVGGVAMAFGLADPALAAGRPAGAEAPCPFLRPLAKCAPEARPREVHGDPSVPSSRRPA